MVHIKLCRCIPYKSIHTYLDPNPRPHVLTIGLLGGERTRLRFCFRLYATEYLSPRCSPCTAWMEQAWVLIGRNRYRRRSLLRLPAVLPRYCMVHCVEPPVPHFACTALCWDLPIRLSRQLVPSPGMSCRLQAGVPTRLHDVNHRPASPARSSCICCEWCLFQFHVHLVSPSPGLVTKSTPTLLYGPSR